MSIDPTALDLAIEHILKSEGGYVNNPHDKGGETNHGITIGTARAHGYNGSMRDLSVEVAREIYKDSYIENRGFDKISDLGTAIHVINFGVMSGGHAKVIESVLAQNGYGAGDASGNMVDRINAMLDDGRIEEFNKELGEARLQYYRDLDTWPQFGRGWTARVEREAALGGLEKEELLARLESGDINIGNGGTSFASAGSVVRSLMNGEQLDREQKQAMADMLGMEDSSTLFFLLSVLLMLGGATPEEYASVMNAFGFGSDGQRLDNEPLRAGAGQGDYKYTSRGYGVGRAHDYSFSGPTYDHQDNPDDQFGFRGNGSFDGVDKRLAHIIEATAMEFPLRVRVMSGRNGRNKGDHAKGLAADITLFDQDGNALGNYQNEENFRAYEAFAQLAYLKAQELYPELTDGRGNDFQWGGLFGGAGPNNSHYKYGSNDTMDFRLAHSSRFRAGTIMGGLNREHSWYDNGDLLGGSQPFSQAALEKTLKELETFRLTPEQAAHNRATMFGVAKRSGTLTARADVAPEQESLKVAQAQAKNAVTAGIAMRTEPQAAIKETPEAAAAGAVKAGAKVASDAVPAAPSEAVIADALARARENGTTVAL